jgi:hypothetical protein
MIGIFQFNRHRDFVPPWRKKVKADGFQPKLHTVLEARGGSDAADASASAPGRVGIGSP